MREHQAVTRTIHWFETIFSIITLKEEHIVLVVIIVTTDSPQVQIEHIRTYHFSVATIVVLLTNELNQTVVDIGSMRQEEAATRTQFMEEEEILLFTQTTMIILLSLFLLLLPFLQLLGVRE